MPSTINADNGVVSGSSGVKTTADTSGVLALQSNGSTGISLGTDLVTTLTNPLPVGSGGTGATSLSGITVGTATTATNLAGGSAGTVPYQTGSGATAMLAAGTSGFFLQSSGAGAPVWAAAGASTNYAAKSTTYTAVAGDKGYLFGCTSTWTLSLTAASTLGNGWFLYLQNLGTGVITVDPNSSETIGGVATAAFRPGDIWLIVCDGTNFQLNRLGGSNYQIFTSTGTFTTPAGVYRIYAEAWGGGGGGSKGNSANLQGSGAGGGYSAGFINTTPGATITATVAAGGTGATTNNTAGAAGGNSTFGALTANGGEQGKLAPNYGYEAMNSQGGTASGGDVNIQGGSCIRFPVASLNDIGTVGGAAPASGGQGGRAAVNVNGPFGATQEPGIPGGGGYAGFASWSNAANGGRGEIRVYWV
jgi:hypothetical protein